MTATAIKHLLVDIQVQLLAVWHQAVEAAEVRMILMMWAEEQVVEAELLDGHQHIAMAAQPLPEVLLEVMVILIVEILFMVQLVEMAEVLVVSMIIQAAAAVLVEPEDTQIKHLVMVQEAVSEA